MEAMNGVIHLRANIKQLLVAKTIEATQKKAGFTAHVLKRQEDNDRYEVIWHNFNVVCGFCD